MDINKLSTWKPYRASNCSDCWAGCCTLPVEATASDLVRLGLLDEDDVLGSLKKAARALIAAGKVKHFRAASGLFTLAQKPNGDCPYLDPLRQCTVYEKRPDVCRKFPTEVGPRLNFCPAKKKK